MRTIKQIAESLAINQCSKITKESIIRYRDEMRLKVKNEIRMGRSPKQYIKYVKAAELALTLI